ncbi:hypothetical protein F7725_007071 [Dissostichus mawsoni]|uniref:Uncharacterized protein n=1 Tax=Dissostichus mawsoni TaxID=36200 RepID=A0A7J5XXH1_DISMA|nr:hypothetical protein F7725_007071 [Dissostichus mawsoni]
MASSDWTQAANQARHRSREEEELCLTGPHHTVGSFHSCSRTCISGSDSTFFLLQNLTAMKIERRMRMTPQVPPTAAARMLISERETRSNNKLKSGITTEHCRASSLTFVDDSEVTYGTLYRKLLKLTWQHESSQQKQRPYPKHGIKHLNCVTSGRMSGDEVNPAAVAKPVEDAQGDDRWMSQHIRFVQECKDAEPDVLLWEIL